MASNSTLRSRSSKGHNSKGVKISQLKRHTHKGRRGKGLQTSDGSMGKAGLGKLTAPLLGAKLAPTPHGPERMLIRGSR